jgi:hypothetical protein
MANWLPAQHAAAAAGVLPKRLDRQALQATVQLLRQSLLGLILQSMSNAECFVPCRKSHTNLIPQGVFHHRHQLTICPNHPGADPENHGRRTRREASRVQSALDADRQR